MPLDGGRTCGDRRHDRSPRSGRDGRRRCRRPRMRRHRPTDMNATVRHRQFNRRGKPHGTDSSARHPTALRAVIARGHDHGRYAPFRGDSHQTLERVDRRGPRVRRKRRRGAVRAAGCRRNAARLTGRAALEIPCRRNRNASGAMGRHRPAVRLPCRAKRDSGPTRRRRRIPACSYFDDGQPHGGCLPCARSRRPSPRLRKRVTRH